MEHRELSRLKRLMLHGDKKMVGELLQRDTPVDNPIDPLKKNFRSLLHSAVYLGDVDIIRKLLEKGASPNVLNVNNETALMLAVKFGKFAIVDLILSHEKLKNCHNNENFTHLHIACIRNQVNIVKKLIEERMDINSSVKPESLRWSGYTPLHFAVEYQSIETVEYLLSLGADITIKNTNQLTALHLADMMRDERMIDMILETHIKVAGNPTNEVGLSHFHIACTRNNPEIVKCFLRNGVDLSSCVRADSLSWSLFCGIDFAIHYDCIDIVRLILEEADREEVPSHDIVDRVELAYSSENEELVDLILKRDDLIKNKTDRIEKLPELHSACIHQGIDLIRQLSAEELIGINEPTSQGSTPLHLAIERRDEAVISYLLKSGADYNAQNADGKTSLHLAFEREMNFIVVSMLSNLSNITSDHVDNDGLSYLHIACAVGERQAVEHLIGLGADVDSTVNFDAVFWPGYTPLHFAAKTGSYKTVRLLLEYGASHSATDKNNQSAFDVAIFQRWYRCQNERFSTVIEEILSHCAEYNDDSFNDRGLSLLHFLSSNQFDKTKDLKQFILDHPNDLNKAVHKIDTPWDGYTPLHFAMKTGHSNNAKLLIEKGADIFSKDSNGDTPFHLILSGAAHRDRVFSLSDIPKSSLDFKQMQHNPVGMNGYSLFHVACAIGNVEWVNFFLSRGVDPNFRARKYCHEFYADTPLHVTLARQSCSKLEIAKLLLEKGASSTARDSFMNTPLHRICENGEPEFVDCLINYGADVNSRNAYLETPLITTCENYDELDDRKLEGMIASLLNHGADINAMDDWRRNPLSHDYWEDFEDSPSCVEVLVKHMKKLKVIGLFISEEIEHSYGTLSVSFPDHMKSNISNFELQCMKERNTLSRISIGNHTSLCDVLFKNLNEMSVWSENDTLQQIMDSDDFQEKFPIYGPILELQLKRGKGRRPLLPEAQQALLSLTRIYLPQECSDVIFKSLTNEDLRNLIMTRKLFQSNRGSRSLIEIENSP